MLLVYIVHLISFEVLWCINFTYHQSHALYIWSMWHYWIGCFVLAQFWDITGYDPLDMFSGHGKFETLGTLGISSMLLVTAGGIAWHAVDILQAWTSFDCLLSWYFGLTQLWTSFFALPIVGQLFYWSPFRFCTYC